MTTGISIATPTYMTIQNFRGKFAITWTITNSLWTFADFSININAYASNFETS
jgi:archaellum component FlaF (FlaF/FlaG flagellin family)